jgi:hypothetical protein
MTGIFDGVTHHLPLSPEDWDWQCRARAAAAEEGLKYVRPGGVIPPGTPVGRLTESDIAELFTAMHHQWVGVRAQQAEAQGRSTEHIVRECVSDAWDAGSIMSVLPELATKAAVDWSLPLNAGPAKP